MAGKLADVAKQAGVSEATVSRVLNGPSAEELFFEPEIVARGSTANAPVAAAKSP